MSHMLNRLSMATAYQGDYERAIRYAEESLTHARKAGDLGAMAWAFFQAGNAVWLKDNEPGQAFVLLQQSLPLFRVTRNRLGVTEVLFSMAVAERAQGHIEQAEALCKESLLLARDLGDEWRIAICLACLGCIARDCNNPRRAAILLSAARSLEKVESIRKLRSNHIDFDAEAAALRTQLDRVAFTATWARGQAMTLGQAIDYGLEDPPSVEV